MGFLESLEATIWAQPALAHLAEAAMAAKQPKSMKKQVRPGSENRI